MQDINDVLAEIELKVARLAMQAEQEKAMAEVLPLRFAKNMVALEQYLPDVAKIFNSYNPTRQFRIFCNENGIPNLEWLDKNIAIYGDDPYADCEKQITDILNSSTLLNIEFSTEKNDAKFIHVEYLNQLTLCNQRAEEQLESIHKVPDSLPLMMMFGVGLGYQLSYLYQRCRVNNLFLFEPDYDLFYASLFCFEWAPLLDYLSAEGLGFHLFLGTDEEYLMTDLLTALHKRGAFMAAGALPCWHYPSSEIFKLIDLVRREFHLLTAGWGFFDDNILGLSHCAANIANRVPFLLKNKFVDDEWKELPVFIVANGPSLDTSLEYVRRYRDQVLLVCCGSTITALFKAGIKPDVHVETERTKVTPDFFAMMNQPDYLRDIFFFGTDVIHPDTMSHFARSGLCFKADEPSGLLCYHHFPASRKWIHLAGVNPTVGNIGLTFACAMGFQNVYLFGVDNGYKEQSHHHSRLSIYFDEDGQDLEDVTALIVGNSDPVVPGNFGGEVRSPFVFNSSRRILEGTLHLCPHVRCMNCSDGAKITGAIPLPPAELQLDNAPVLAKQALLDHIFHDLFAPIDIPVEQMHVCLDVEFFNSLINRLVDEWGEPFSSRSEVADRMMRHYGYLNAVSESMQRHIYKMLIGSMNYAFSSVNSLLYRFEDEQETLRVVRDAIGIVQSYLREIQRIYPKALSSIDQVDHAVIDLLRKGNQKSQ
ncbi:6-hydroxymethylpterin diphosphokinase MptE-like protein [uncultured Tolumonas sp.]|uniref:motility associated factor glycosyltransferase family protein n=1 Tax=uncultured Tolumonas sp. TaxID=263765 RepID=UPI0029315959|nr:6-hydroxymethylpterin diphosphokinase MptE-like protein [uncultured Tolumonas sp.]